MAHAIPSYMIIDNRTTWLAYNAAASLRPLDRLTMRVVFFDCPSALQCHTASTGSCSPVVGRIHSYGTESCSLRRRFRSYWTRCRILAECCRAGQLKASWQRGRVHFLRTALAYANVAGIFPSETAIRRLVGAMLMKQNDECAIQDRFMSLESLAAMSDNPAIRLPAASAPARLWEATRATETDSNPNASCTASRHATRSRTTPH